MVSPDDFIGFAHQLADAAGAAIRPYFGAHGDVEAKGDSSPVTIADRAAETAMRALIAQHFPEHGIYGEEHGCTGTERNYVWVIDPIDGTRAFIAGKKEWGTLIALCENGVPVLGILDQPVTGERWVGVEGVATFYTKPVVANAGSEQVTAPFELTLSTRSCTALTEASISSTYCAPPDDQRYAALAKQCQEQIVAGDCYAYGLLASGKRDIVCDTALKPYDILALVPIIEGAGGVITGWDGKPVTLTHYAQVVAAGDKSLHSQALALLQGA